MSWHGDGNGEHHRGRLGYNTREFEPGPATSGRRMNFYGAFRRSPLKPHQVKRAIEAATPARVRSSFSGALSRLIRRKLR